MITPLILNALVIIGVWEASAPGMILDKPCQWITKRLGMYWSKPICNCPVCMASVWGLSFYFLHDYCKPFWYVLALSGLVKLVMKVIFQRVY